MKRISPEIQLIAFLCVFGFVVIGGIRIVVGPPEPRDIASRCERAREIRALPEAERVDAMRRMATHELALLIGCD